MSSHKDEKFAQRFPCDGRGSAGLNQRDGDLSSSGRSVYGNAVFRPESRTRPKTHFPSSRVDVSGRDNESVSTIQNRRDVVRRGQRLEYFTIGYNSLEGLVSIVAGHSRGP